MYGTVARIRIKASEIDGIEEKMQAMSRAPAPGQVGVIVYQLDRDQREFIMAVVFESKEAYQKNADSPEQDEQFRKFAALLETEPEWNDGHVVSYQMER